jgi:hypothetical protein
MQQSYFQPGDFTSGWILFQWDCSRCRAHVKQTRQFRRGDAIWIPQALPAGWNKVGDQIFCPEHRVRTFIDDKLFGTEGQM